MALLALGDIHGRSLWKDIIRHTSANLIVFVGDYFDSHEGISGKEQLQNFREILDYKKDRPQEVVLLLGNHDYHYLDYSQDQYSGYQHAVAPDIHNQLTEALEQNLMQVCFSSGELLFSHAGITRTWARANEIDMQRVEGSVNEVFRQHPQAFGFTPGENRDPTGNDISQGPFWVRPASLEKDKPEGYRQVVGHTMQEHMREKNGIYLIDTLGTSGEFFYQEDSDIRFRSL